MNTRYFNGAVMPPINHYWAAQALQMQENPKKGPDLIDKEKTVELKFKVLYERKYTHKCWRTLEHQLNYPTQEKPAVWGLGFYTLSKLARLIPIRNIRFLEKLVTFRELYLIEWQWIMQFPALIWVSGVPVVPKTVRATSGYCLTGLDVIWMLSARR